MSFGGFEQRGHDQPMAEINTTPLVDVMLVLLVIFIITAPLLTHAIRVDLPGAQAPVDVPDPGTVTLSIDADGTIYWNEDAITGEELLAARLAEAAARSPAPRLQLRADRETRFQRIADLMAAVQAAGLPGIGFVTQPGIEPRPHGPRQDRSQGNRTD